MKNIEKENKHNGETVGVYIDKDLLQWIDKMVEQKMFSGRSHAVQACLFNYKKHIESNKNDS